MIRLILQIIIGILGLWIAIRIDPPIRGFAGPDFIGPIKALFGAGLILGLINFFIKPIIKVISLPLRILTFGLFGLIINMAMIWLVDVIFPELIFPQWIIPKLVALLWTTIIIWGLNLFLNICLPRKTR